MHLKQLTEMLAVEPLADIGYSLFPRRGMMLRFIDDCRFYSSAFSPS